MDRNESRISEITNKIVDEIEDTFEEYAKLGKRHSTREVMQKILDKYKSEIVSDADKDYVNKELKYRYFLYTNKQPKDFVFESRAFTTESNLLRDIRKILNEEASEAPEFVKIPNSALKYLDGVQLFTYNDPNYSDSGLFDEEFSERDDEYVQEILNGKKQHVFTIKDDEVYVNDKVPVDINYSKHSEDPHACGTIIYKNPDNFKEVFSSDLTDDPRDSVNSDDIWFQVRIADLSNDKIKELVTNCEFSDTDKRNILKVLSKDELMDLL